MNGFPSSQSIHSTQATVSELTTFRDLSSLQSLAPSCMSKPNLFLLPLSTLLWSLWPPPNWSTFVPLLTLYLCLNFHPSLRKRTPTHSSSSTQMIFDKKKKHWRDFPGDPVVNTSRFLCRRLGDSPWSLKTSHAHAAWSSQEKKKKALDKGSKQDSALFRG